MTQRTLLLLGMIGALVLGGCQSNGPQARSADATAPTSQARAHQRAPARSEAVVASNTFGAPQKLTAADAVPASKVLADSTAYANKYVRLTGKVSDVCTKKGCWLRVVPADAQGGAEDIFIKFPDPPTGVLVPRDAIGKDVTVEGTVKLGQISQAMARHFKEDAGAPQAEIEKIVGPQKQVMISGPSVAIDGVRPPATASKQ